ncbi:unnamed protein product [Urochloa humidicola]
MRPPHPPPPATLSRHHLLRIRRCLPPVHARDVAPGLATHPSVFPRLAAGKVRAFENLLIWGYAGRGMWGDVVLAYENMLSLGAGADRFAYPLVLRARGEVRDAAFGRGIEQRIQRWGYGLDMYVWNALVGMYAKCVEMEDARGMFDGMPVRDVVSWNAMVSGYVLAVMWVEAFELLQQVPGANILTWNVVAAGKLKVGNYDEVMRLVLQMRSSHGPGLDFVTVVVGLKACGRNVYMRTGWELHGVAVRLCFDRLECVECSLITMYSRCQMMSSAYRLFRTCSVRSAATWNSLLAGFAFMDLVEEVILLFRKMTESAVFPNDATVLTMLSLCARFEHLCHGRAMQCYIYILKHGLSGSNLLQNSLVVLLTYTQSPDGWQLPREQGVFDQMQYQDRHTYTDFGLWNAKRGSCITEALR